MDTDAIPGKRDQRDSGDSDGETTPTDGSEGDADETSDE